MYTGRNLASKARAILNEGMKATVAEVCEILEDEFGSGHDPVFMAGSMMMPSDLRYNRFKGADARKMRLSYYAAGKRGLNWINNGTLVGMLRCRATPAEPQVLTRRPTCPTCGKPR